MERNILTKKSLPNFEDLPVWLLTFNSSKYLRQRKPPLAPLIYHLYYYNFGTFPPKDLVLSILKKLGITTETPVYPSVSRVGNKLYICTCRLVGFYKKASHPHYICLSDDDTLSFIKYYKEEECDDRGVVYKVRRVICAERCASYFF